MDATTTEVKSLTGTTQSADQAKRSGDETKFHFALPYLLMNVDMEELPPIMYLKAAGESLASALAISWAITLYIHPEVVQNNPLKERLGYNNLCIGWDTPPSTYVAGVLWIVVAYMTLRFNTMNWIRYKLLQESAAQKSYAFGKCATVAFAIAVCTFTLCLLIPPTDDHPSSVYYHTLPFIGIIVTRYLIVLSLVLELKWSQVPETTKAFVILYGFVSLVFPIIVLSEFVYFSRHGVKSPFPYQITFALDYTWFACLPLTSKILPSNVVIRRTFELITLHHV